MPTAFVLSGGASFGATQAGMLQALYERGICPDMFVGTSAGALNAAFAAFRPQTLETALDLQAVWRKLTRSSVFPPNPLAAGLGFLGLRDHSVRAGGLRRIVTAHVGADLLEEAQVPLHVVTVDALSGEEVLLSAGSIVDAVLASAAIPGVFPPVEWGDRLLIDGGVLNNAPISHAVALGADRVIVLPAMTSRALSCAPRGALAAAVTALSRTIARRLEEDIALFGGLVDLMILPAPDLAGIMPTDFGHADELIAQGLAGSRAGLRRPSVRRPSVRRPLRSVA
jgi:NTE family protein